VKTLVMPDRWGLALTLLLVSASLSPRADQAVPAGPVPSVQFSDVTARSKIDFVHQSGASAEKYMVETFGSGVAWIDYDNDGFVDLYFVNGAPGSANALYRNNHDGTFADVTRQAGVAAAPAARTRPAWRQETSMAMDSWISTSPRSDRTSCSGTMGTAASRT
jgi:hypothetical protein